MSRRILVATLSLVALVVLYGAAAWWVSGTDRVARNTTVLGVAIGDMAPEEATALVTAEVQTRTQRAINVAVDEMTLQVIPADAGLTVDVAATLAPALTRVWAPHHVLPRLWGTVALRPVVSVDSEVLKTTVQSLAADVDQPAVEPTITYRGTEPVLREGQSGQILDQSLVRDRLTEQFLSSERLEVRRSPQMPSVSGEEARRVLSADALTAVASSVDVVARDGMRVAEATLTPAEIAAALNFTAMDGTLAPVLDADVLRRGISNELIGFERPGRDATFRIEGDRPVVVPAITGLGVNPQELLGAVSGVLLQAAPRQIEVGVGPIEPALTTAQAQALGVVEKISSFTQNYPYAAYRVINIGKAAEYIDGTLVMPGATYSHNDTLKERTQANGYTEGYIIGPGGIFRKELGGGVSASATAMWTAAFFAGMDPVQVRAHSIWIPRYQPGLEATVSWGNFDLKWRNPAPTAVYITASTTSTSLTITFWGTRQYDAINDVSSPKQDIRSFTTVTSDDPDCEPQVGQIGFRITVDRVFTNDGAEVKRDQFTTTYRPSPTVKCSGTSAAPTATPTRTVRPTRSPSATPTASPSVTSSSTPTATTPPATTSGSPSPTSTP